MNRIEILFKDINNIKKNHYLFYYIAITVYFHNVMTNLVYYLHKQDKILHDLLFDILPRYHKIGTISDIFSILYFIIFLIFIIHPYFIKRKYLTTDILFVMIKTYILTTILRCLSFIFTILPSPSDQCIIGSKEYNPPKLKEIFTRFDMFNGCGDLIFSGHTNIIMIISVIIIYYIKGIFNKRLEGYIIIFITLYTLFFFVIILIARNHYTVDVIVAIYTTILSFYLVMNNFKIHKKEQNKINNDIEEEYIDEELPPNYNNQNYNNQDLSDDKLL